MPPWLIEIQKLRTASAMSSLDRDQNKLDLRLAQSLHELSYLPTWLTWASKNWSSIPRISYTMNGHVPRNRQLYQVASMENRGGEEDDDGELGQKLGLVIGGTNGMGFFSQRRTKHLACSTRAPSRLPPWDIIFLPPLLSASRWDDVYTE